jgi:hypothetical protein
MLYCKKKQEKTNMEQLDKEERWNKNLKLRKNGDNGREGWWPGKRDS